MLYQDHGREDRKCRRNGQGDIRVNHYVFMRLSLNV